MTAATPPTSTPEGSALITPEMVDLPLEAPDKDTATRLLAERLVAAGRVTDLDGFLADVRAREAQMPTGLEGGIGIPHCRSEHVTVATVGFGRSEQGVDYGAADGPAHLIFLIAAPAGGGSEHIKILAALARRLVRQEFKDRLRAETDPAAAAYYIVTEVTP
jgi:fructose-specific phosphotransferase system IIA component